MLRDGKTGAPLRGIIALAAALISVGGTGCRRGGSSPVSEAGSAQAGSRIGPFRLGEQVRNHANLKLRLELGGRGAVQEMEMDGDWIATPTDVQGGLVQVACALENLRVHVGDGGARPPPPATPGEQTAQERELGAAVMGVSFFVSYEPDGAVVGFWFPRGTTPGVGNLLITLAAAQQLVRAPQAAPAWVIQESDANGRYLAAYRESAPGRFNKQKARYLETNELPNPIRTMGGGAMGMGSPHAAPAVRPAIRVERSELELGADDHGRLLELRGTEVLTLELGSAGLAMRTTVGITLTDSRTTNAAAEVGAFARARATLESQPMEQMGLDAPAEALRRDRMLLDGAGLDELHKALAALPADASTSNPDVSALVRRFAALLRTDPAAAGRVPGIVGGAIPAQGKLLVDALSLAGTPNCQKALAIIALNRDAPALARQYAVQYIAQQEQPGGEVVTALARLLDDRDQQLHQMARLSYGTCANSLRSPAPDRSRRIVDDLTTRLDRAASETDRLDFVMALGNAGDAATLPVLERLIKEGSVSLRATAVDALRFVQSPTVDPLLTSLLVGSSEDRIRLAAIGAIRFRQVGPFAAALADIARRDPTPAVRNAAVALLGDRMTTLPTLRPVLEEIQKTDRAPANRALAARYLGHRTLPDSRPNEH